MVPSANVAGIAFGVLAVPLILFLLVTRLGLLYPRLGRWIDRRAYRRAPRLGHLFMSEEEIDEEAKPATRSTAENAFGEQKRD